MIRDVLFGNRSLALFKKGLDASAERMRVIAENVANVASPDYQAKRVEFEELIGAARTSVPMERTHATHLAGPSNGTGELPEPQVKPDRTPVPEGAVNNVDIERELVLMKKNELHYQALSQLVARKYKGLEDAIR